MLGTEDSLNGARGFVTQQHGDNNVYEFVQRRDRNDHDDDHDDHDHGDH
jgi:hypothetical protein